MSGTPERTDKTTLDTAGAIDCTVLREWCAIYLSGGEPATPVAVEASGNWYWILDDIGQAGCQPQLVHPRKV